MRKIYNYTGDMNENIYKQLHKCKSIYMILKTSLEHDFNTQEILNHYMDGDNEFTRNTFEDNIYDENGDKINIRNMPSIKTINKISSHYKILALVFNIINLDLAM